MKLCKNCKYYYDNNEFKIIAEFVDAHLKSTNVGKVICYEGSMKMCQHPVCFQTNKYSYKDPVNGYGSSVKRERVSGQTYLNENNDCRYYERKWYKIWV